MCCEIPCWSDVFVGREVYCIVWIIVSILLFTATEVLLLHCLMMITIIPCNPSLSKPLINACGTNTSLNYFLRCSKNAFIRSTTPRIAGAFGCSTPFSSFPNSVISRLCSAVRFRGMCTSNVMISSPTKFDRMDAAPCSAAASSYCTACPAARARPPHHSAWAP